MNSALQELYRKYPTPDDFFHAYSPALQQYLLSTRLTPALLLEKKGIPTLFLLAQLYGESTPKEWIRTQLESLNALAESRLQMSVTQLNETSTLIFAAYSWMTAAEVCLFVARTIVGHYGPFYGSIAPLKIMEFLQTFAAECCRARNEQAHRRAQQTPVATEEQRPVTYEEYQEICRRAAENDPDAIRELNPPAK